MKSKTKFQKTIKVLVKPVYTPSPIKHNSLNERVAFPCYKKVSFSFITVFPPVPSSPIAGTERTELHVFKRILLIRILVRFYRGHQDFLNEVKVGEVRC